MRRGDPGGARRWPWLPTAHNATYALKSEAGQVDTDAYPPIRARLAMRPQPVMPVVFFGSSNTQNAAVDADKRWINILAAMFTDTPTAGWSWTTATTTIQNAPPGLIFVNMGRSGTETHNYIDPAYITSHLPLWKPALIFHLASENDATRGGTPANAAANIAANIAAIDAACALPVGNVYVHVRERFDRPLSYPWGDYPSAMRSMAASRPNVSVVDLSGSSAPSASPTRTRSTSSTRTRSTSPRQATSSKPRRWQPCSSRPCRR
ncbi:SGNH/GDSL hydrolase family protein [Dietzia sp. Alg238-R159]|uniref:SGNH/GDSL hydrolase family protein n=1 Tax=Dietzia sp. Alg238-R159 TaxID=2305986 RepID=UPI0013D5A14A|nr:SGNH/GDSL hydrolase family protein [Dietzia sp. Alg238-R159]